MKKAIDNNGLEVEVPLDTPVKTIDGVHYLLTDADAAEIAASEAQWQSQAAARNLNAVLAKRSQEYGAIGEQLDMIYHDGLDAWKDHIAAVKLNNPKP